MPLYNSITLWETSKGVFEERQHENVAANNEIFDSIRFGNRKKKTRTECSSLEWKFSLIKQSTNENKYL